MRKAYDHGPAAHEYFNLDDMSAALGKFSFKVLVQGMVMGAGRPNQYEVTITDIGVYVRDSYDFNGDQLLGYWNETTNKMSMINPLAGEKVTNKDFRDWRANNAKGGDFLVFSNIKQITLQKPDSFIAT
ncbi:MAG: DUF6402 family protein [Burkholderiales bacterium]